MTSRALLVGDIHAVADELDDCQALINGVESTILAEKPDYVVLLGDQHHNHAVISLAVMNWWKKALAQLARHTKIYLLVGNHDMAGDGSSKDHALRAYEDMKNVFVVDQPTVIPDNTSSGVLLVPYQHAEQDFRDILKNYPHQTVLAHQTFQGATYDNGFYAKDGFVLDGLTERHFISGHIHKPAKFANVTYVGAPRWRTLSDADTSRAIVLMDLEDGVAPKVLKLIGTEDWCRRIVHLVDKEESPLDVAINPNWQYRVDIHGSEAFIQGRKSLWAGCKVRTFKTSSTSKAQVSESMGIGLAISTFVDGFKPKFGTPLEYLRSMVAKRLT